MPEDLPSTTPEAKQSLYERMLKAGWIEGIAHKPDTGFVLRLTPLGRGIFSDLRAFFLELGSPLTNDEIVALYITIGAGKQL